MFDQPMMDALLDDARKTWPAQWTETKVFSNRATFAVAVDLIINKLGFFQKKNDVETFEGIKKKVNLFDDADYVFRQMLEILCEEGILRHDDNEYRCVESYIEIESPSEVIARAIREIPQEGAFFQWLARSTGKLHEFIKGQAYGEEILFPFSDFSLLEDVYNTSDVSGYYPKLTAKAIRRIMDQEFTDKITMVEVGSGTGNSAANVFAALEHPADRIEKFVFTDISKALIKQSKKKFEDLEFMQYQTLDLGRNLLEQDMTDGMADIVFGVNVLHATDDLSISFKNLYQLMKPGGFLVLGEISPPPNGMYRYMELTFGLLGSYYKYNDRDIRPNTPLMRPDVWIASLTTTGFSQIVNIPDDTEPDIETGGVVIAKK
ncbi:class I SAM-dependent methyltransferase [Candidatus Latescibacterota bacterium]